MLNTNRSSNGLCFDENRIFFNRPMDYIDHSIPLFSPINPSFKLYPPSTRNYFNIDLLSNYNIVLPGITINQNNYNNNYISQIKTDECQLIDNFSEQADQTEESKGGICLNLNKRPKLDLNVINESETTKIFAKSYVNSYNTAFEEKGQTQKEQTNKIDL